MTEREIADWLLTNQPLLQETIKSLHRPAHHLFPHVMQEIYYQQYQDGVLRIVREEAGKSCSSINPEELMSLITKSLIRKVAPKLLEQPQ